MQRGGVLGLEMREVRFGHRFLRDSVHVKWGKQENGGPWALGVFCRVKACKTHTPKTLAKVNTCPPGRAPQFLEKTRTLGVPKTARYANQQRQLDTKRIRNGPRLPRQGSWSAGTRRCRTLLPSGTPTRMTCGSCGVPGCAAGFGTRWVRKVHLWSSLFWVVSMEGSPQKKTNSFSHFMSSWTLSFSDSQTCFCCAPLFK